MLDWQILYFIGLACASVATSQLQVSSSPAAQVSAGASEDCLSGCHDLEKVDCDWPECALCETCAKPKTGLARSRNVGLAVSLREFSQPSRVQGLHRFRGRTHESDAAGLAEVATSKKAILTLRETGCFTASPHSPAERDAACEGDLVCARIGHNGRDFGCRDKHCCTQDEAKPTIAKSCERWCYNEEYMDTTWVGKRCTWQSCAQCEPCAPGHGQKVIFPLDAGCYIAGDDMATRDASCEGSLVCARTGHDGRHFGCNGHHCCSVNMYEELTPNTSATCDAWCFAGDLAGMAWRGKKCGWAHCAGCEDCDHPKGQQGEIFMKYMPSANLVVCGCGKCGSTSLYTFLYEKVFGHPWNYTGPPWAQNVTTERWENRFQVIHDEPTQRQVMAFAYSFALIRDPRERIISAWKSKVACDDLRFGVDKVDRTKLMRLLQTLLPDGREINTTCLELEDFLEVLSEIHDAGKEQYLDKHFLPQDLGCFHRFPPSRWSRITSMGEPQGLLEMSRRFGAVDVPPLVHASKDFANVSLKTARLLDKVTRLEYNMLRPYLPAERDVQSLSGTDDFLMPKQGHAHAKEPRKLGSGHFGRLASRSPIHRRLQR